MTVIGATNVVAITKGRPEADPAGVDGPVPDPGQLQRLAHDLRQPVAAILALASAAQSQADVPAQVRQHLEQISAQGDWIFQVISDLLNTSGGDQTPEPVPIVSLLGDVVASERLTFRGQIEFRVDDQGPRHVLAVGTRLRRALANVLANATRAAGPSGRVELTAGPHGDTEIIEIADDGPGFGHLGQVHGIGLQITRQLLAECGGRLETDRQPPGTVVRLILPLLITSQPAISGQQAGAR